MTNLETYKIDGYLYRLNDEYMVGQSIYIIRSIVQVVNDCYFFCEKKNDKFRLKASATIEVAANILPIHSIVFHNMIITN